ncbi:glycosyltransferase family 2 protein [Actinomycetospora sp. NBRC 106378]|uniref:glycosyltransferase family 2 protein n=1 Tax=Actinomycetospora sp. NBRC 106378 TaxID=3032208 RepID=UPI0024A00D75|nr:glycosyltransferase family 2 protein [Actinomycetospora sp. NBRC 106378]GLZ51777.1 hypothetical protein Acsp07_13940 [Actinomycetospora sp. NBRC 106378]
MTSSTDAPVLGVVVVHFRSEDTVVDTVSDVRAVAPDERIVLVDNSGTLEPGDFAVRVVAPEVNGGYAGGVNRGVAELPADVDTVLVVTHEVRVDPASVTAMTADLTDGVGQVGPVLVDASSPDGAIWSAGGHYSRFLAYPRHRLSVDDRAEVGWIDGAVFVSPRAAFDAVGGVPEHFFSYMEDIAYSRSLLAAGYRVTVSPAARAEQSGKGPSIRLAVRNRWLLLREFFPPVVATAGVAQLHLKARLLALVPTAFHRDRAREYRAGLTDARRIHAERRAALQEAS